MLNFNAISKGKLVTEPYKWGVLENVWENEKVARLLASEFPTEDFSYRLYGKGFYLKRTLVKLGEKGASEQKDLSPSYVKLAKDLCSDDFRTSVEKATGMSLAGHPMEAVLFRTGHFTAFSMHDDVMQSAVRLTFYLNDNWSKENGGHLEIMDTRNGDKVVGKIVPELGKAAVIVRSESSPHNVSAISSDYRDSRNTLVVTFYKAGTKTTRK